MAITDAQRKIAEGIQFAAARDPAAQVRLVAGPGTGKSYTIEERVRWLLADQGLAPRALFVTSFTRASSNDLRLRIRQYCDSRGVGNVSAVSVTTLHSLALRVLRAAGMLSQYPAEPIVLDRWELKNIFDSEASVSFKRAPGRCESIRIEHEAFWSTGVWSPPNYMPPTPSITVDERTAFAGFCGPRTQVYSCVLPGEIIRKCVDVVEAGTVDPVHLLQIEHLIVDEFQDLNPCDLQFVEQLIRAGVKVFVAGDDDQSVYSFRYALPEGIQDFASKYAGTGTHTLNDCFRCTPKVLVAADRSLAGYLPPKRITKALRSLYAAAAPQVDGSVMRWKFRRGEDEAMAIALSCRDLIAAGMNPREILVLINNRNALEQEIYQAFAALKVPVAAARADDYTDSAMGRFALTCLRIICNPSDYVAHRTLLGILPGIGVATCNGIAEACLHKNLKFIDLFHAPLPVSAFDKRARGALSRAAVVCGSIDSWRADDTLAQRTGDMQRVLREVFGEDGAVAWIDETKTLEPDMRLDELRDYLMAESEDQVSRVLHAVSLRLNEAMPPVHVFPSHVRMMTMHGAKGLDASVVFIPGLEDDLIPGSKRKAYPGLVLEAARLLYVSITRARAACVLSFSEGRRRHGKFERLAPSRFTTSTGGPFVARSGGMNTGEVAAVLQDVTNMGATGTVPAVLPVPPATPQLPVTATGGLPQGSVAEPVRSAAISWLHLTDLHQGMSHSRWLWPNVREEFFADLGRLHEQTGPWDLVLFTGDLTQRGTEAEFDALTGTLDRLWRHLATLGSTPVLLPVPGNHDLARPSPTASTVRALRHWTSDEDLRRAFWETADNEYRRTVGEALGAYQQWWHSKATSLPSSVLLRHGLLPGDFSATVTKDGMNLGVVGLNSTFLQLTDGDFEGRLEIETQQFHVACGGDAPDWLQQHHASVLLTHHPVNWLHPEARSRFRAEIDVPGRFLAHIHGHMHTPATTVTSEGGAAARRALQGGALFGLETWQRADGSQAERIHGYSVSRLTRRGAQGELRVWPRKMVLNRASGHRRMVADHENYVLDALDSTSFAVPIR
ncbi:MAG: hypothetical protein EPO40_23845 [Myxococcaceae bacterium]|nr:MAG: hypothetical protein EPO40_23845 [Myxococcaceae bacterium]